MSENWTVDIVLEEFPARTSDKICYGDTDRQGHVNNAVFATFLETGRVEILHGRGDSLADPGAAFVIARLVLDFRAEVTWPGEVTIGTRVAAIGRSSVKLEQGIFQNGKCVATAETTIVQMDETTRSSRPLSQLARDRLAAFSGSSLQSELSPRGE
jgi:acyl-CoA thioester hydrolase